MGASSGQQGKSRWAQKIVGGRGSEKAEVYYLHVERM